MQRATIAIATLAVALVASNSWWAYQLFDVGISYSHLESSFRLNHGALRQALSVIKAAALPDATRESIISAATQSAPLPPRAFEKEGFVWVGDLGLRFSESGRLIEASPSWSPFP